MTNPTYHLACLEKYEAERQARAALALVNSQLAFIRKFKRSRAWKQAERTLRQCKAISR